MQEKDGKNSGILVAATHNEHKLREFREIIGNLYDVKGLHELGLDDDIEETGITLEENSQLKACWVRKHLGEVNCFADDTGLEVEALDGEPGVFSARWAGEGCTPARNVEKMLRVMRGVENRRARFRTVITLLLDGMEYVFSGEVKGLIAEHKSGAEGFGYDPVFIPEGWNKTFAEGTPEEKNAISHRGRALRAMLDFLKNYNKGRF